MRKWMMAVVAFVAGLLLGGAVLAVAAVGTDPSTYVPPCTANTDSCRQQRIVALENHYKQHTHSPTPTPTATATATATSTATATATSTATATATATAPAGICRPGSEIVKFTGQGSAGLAQYGQGNYDASAELWGVSGYNYAQTMGVCTHDSWYVDVTTDNSKGDGAVKAYPSMRRIYHDWGKGSNFSADPLVTSFPRLDVKFAATDPATCPACIYDTAFDLWLNGIGNGTANEVMIWTHNVGQTPYGSKVASGVSLAGHTWDLWAGNSNHYLAFVPTDTGNIPAATFNMRDFIDYLTGHGQLATTSRLGQISYGVETVSTNAVSRHWDFTAFSITDN